MLERIKLKENYTIEDLKKEKRIIFFDIDNTLGGSNMHFGLYSFEKYAIEKKNKCEEFKARLGVNFSLADYRNVSIECLALFFKTLKETNSVAFCVSSWVTSSTVRGDKADINPIDLIEKVFQDTFPEWEDGTIVGGLSRCPQDRGFFCKELSDFIGCDYFVIDDSHHEYEERNGLIEVDGHNGYTYRNYREITDKWCEE